MLRPTGMSLPINTLPGARAAETYQSTNPHPMRVDSPLDVRASLSSDEMTGDDDRDEAPRERTVGPTSTSIEPEQREEPGRRFMFIDANETRNPRRQREMRKHIMHDFIDKERSKAHSSDPRARPSVMQNTSNPRKRPRSPESGRVVQETSINVIAPSRIFEQPKSNAAVKQTAVHSTSNAEAVQTRPAKLAKAQPENDYGTATRPATSSQAPHAATYPPVLPSTQQAQKPGVSRTLVAAAENPLVRGQGVVNSDGPYMRTNVASIPTFGSKINAFGSWPRFSTNAMNIERQKWNCSRLFRTSSMAASWSPTLLRAQHAFLSTVCLCTAHDDIMARGRELPSQRSKHESFERLQARIEVINLINDAMSDPKMRTTDETIIAVLQLLNSEIMGCNDKVTSLHQEGLHDMVRSRGGLDSLGVDGQLASVLTITMYLISVLREAPPHADFVEYAHRNRTKPPNDYRPIPESPVYCRPTGYYTIKFTASRPGHATLDLLEDLRLLTNAFAREADSTFVSPLTPVRRTVSWNNESDNVSALYDRIFATLPAAAHPRDFRSDHERCVFEAIRLTGRVYAYALKWNVPFSTAGDAVMDLDEAGQPRSDSGPRTPVHILIKSQLARTSLSECWGHMTGVLFWLAIVAGACANPEEQEPATRSPTATSPASPKESDAEDARRWLSAIAVRCSIVLSFQYGGAMLETLKRMVGIEQVLGNGEREDTEECQEDVGSGAEREIKPEARLRGSIHGRRRSTQRVFYGPQAPLAMQLGFQDYVLGFEGS